MRGPEKCVQCFVGFYCRGGSDLRSRRKKNWLPSVWLARIVVVVVAGWQESRSKKKEVSQAAAVSKQCLFCGSESFLGDRGWIWIWTADNKKSLLVIFNGGVSAKQKKEAGQQEESREKGLEEEWFGEPEKECVRPVEREKSKIISKYDNSRSRVGSD